jgi:hypothetical protein
MKAQMKTETKERPILFSGPMVRGILEGRKTQTRRVIAKVPDGVTGVTHNNAKDIWFWWDGRLAGEVVNPYGKPGDRLWVRETFKPTNPVLDSRFLYRADLRSPDLGKPWKPSIFMPREASRLTLEITNVRVERLNDISGADALLEGITATLGGTVFGFAAVKADAKRKFAMLWDVINAKKHPWASNPWVWVMEFKQI